MSSKSPKAPNGVSAIVLKAVICAFVGTQPTPRSRRLGKSTSGNPLPFTCPERSLQQIITISSRFIDISRCLYFNALKVHRYQLSLLKGNG